MDNTNNPTEKPVASNTPSGQEQVSSVVPNGYKQRGNGSTFLVVMLIFLVLGGIVSFVYFKLDSSVGGFEDVGKQIVEFFEELDEDDSNSRDDRDRINIDDVDLDLPDIDTPEINMPSQSDIDSAADNVYKRRAEMLGYDTSVDISEHFNLTLPDMKLMREEEYGYYFVPTKDSAEGIQTVQLYAIANPETTSAEGYASDQHDGTLEVQIVNNHTWYGFVDNYGSTSIYHWYTEDGGKIFDLNIRSLNESTSYYSEIIRNNIK